MIQSRSIVRLGLSALLLAGPGVAPVLGQMMSAPVPGQPAGAQVAMLKDVRIDQKLDGQIPLNLSFVDENGKDVKLGDYFTGKKPVVLALVYYECPMLCTLVLNGLVGTMQTINFDAGKDFDVVAVSFDPGETPALAKNKKDQYNIRYRRPGTEGGFHYLTGREENIKALADAVGFRYTYDPASDQFAHPAAITVLTPAGKISRYLYGIDYAPKDFRLALVEASSGQIGTLVDQALLYCYHYDPSTGKYGLAILNVVRFGGVLTLTALGASILLTLRRDRRKGTAASTAATGHS